MRSEVFVLIAVIMSSLGSASAQSSGLFTAARSNDVKLAQKMFDEKADVNQQDDKGYSPLILATYNDNFEVAAFLLKHGAKTELKDSSGRTALMGACFKGNDRDVKLLLENGANPEATDSRGMTSMMYAAMFGRISVIRTLHASENARPAAAQISGSK